LSAEAAATGTMLAVTMPGCMVDVLVSRWSSGKSDPASAARAARVAGLIAAATIGAVALVLALWTPDGWLPWLLLLFAVRPIAESALVVPVAALRSQFRFREIAIIDSIAAISAAVLGILLAFLKAGPLALAAPPVAMLATRAVLSRNRAGTRGAGQPSRTEVSGILGSYALASIAQYLHGLVVTADVLVLSWMSTPESVGFYVFAMSLAMQAHSVFVLQLSSTLQPIYASLNRDPSRQFDAVWRTIRCMSAVALPLAASQVVIGGCLIRLVFGERWEGAAPIYAVSCVTMALGAGAAPLMALIKARGDFRFFTAWQAIQLGITTIACVAACAGDHAGWIVDSLEIEGAQAATRAPIAVALVVALVWFVSMPFAIRLGRYTPTIGAAIASLGLLRPGIASMGLAIVGTWVVGSVRAGLPATWADIVSVVVVGPSVFALGIAAAMASDRRVRSDAFAIMGRVGGRLRSFRGSPTEAAPSTKGGERCEC
jgi:hypothetical protein